MADLSQIKVKATADGVDCREITINTNLPYQDQFIEYSQLDAGSRFLKITYCIGDRVKTFTNLNTARLFLFKQVDGTNIIDDCYVDVEENCIWCELPIQALILAGTDDIGFLVDEYNSTTQTTSAIISTTLHAKVNKCVVSSEVTNSPEYTSFVNGLQTLDTYDIRLGIIETSVGNITLLNTTDKTSLVNAINELNNSKLDKTGDASNTTIAFTQATTLANVVTGEKSSILLGKIMKFFSFIGTTTLTTTAKIVTDAINELKTLTTTIKTIFTPLYSASLTYALGKYVMYSDTLYKCTTAITVAESWNAAHWTATNVGTELSTANTNIATNTSSIGTINTSITTLNTSVTNIKSDIAPTYSPSSTYTLGKFVIYNDILYKCTTAITVAEAWTVGHWTVANVGDLISVLNTNILNYLPCVTSTVINMSTNFDTLANGTYFYNGYAGTGGVNYPVTSEMGFVMVIKYSATYILELFFSFNGKIYQRSQPNSVWDTVWKSVTLS